MKKTLVIFLASLSLSAYAEKSLLDTDDSPMPVQLPENNSNFVGQTYPMHKCEAPSEVVKPTPLKEERTDEDVVAYNKSVEEYNMKVEVFKKDARNYLDCVELFVSRGQNDLQTIKNNLESSINEANDFVKKYQK